MTLARTQLGRRSVSTSGEVLAAGSSTARRRIWIALGCGLLILAYLDWLFGRGSPRVAALALGTALAVGALGTLVLALGLWRRARSWQVCTAGIHLVLGGPLFGDRQLIPWGSITHFGGRRTGPDEVCLNFRQQHINGGQTLPGRPLTVEEYDRLIDRLRVVIGRRYPQLDLGGLTE